MSHPPVQTAKTKPVAVVAGAAEDDAGQKQRYWAIRSSEYLVGAAIFTALADCSVYLESAGEGSGGGGCDYKICESFQHAVAYLKPPLPQQKATLKPPPPPVAVAAPASTTTSKTRAAAPATAPQASPPTAVTSQKRKRYEEPCTTTSKKKPKKGSKDVAASSKTAPTPSDRSKAVDLARKEADLVRSRRIFDERMELLKEFKSLHGTIDVPKSSGLYEDKFKKLYNWLVRMRQELKQDEGGPLTEEQRQKLLDMGVRSADVEQKRRERRAELDSQFDNMLEKLACFRDEHGHCNVPHRVNGKEPPLRKWILCLRREYNNMKEGLDHIITPERLLKLTSMSTEILTPTREIQSFQKRAQSWLEYRTKYGREPSVHSDEFSSLAIWACKVRSQYRKHLSGEKSYLRQDQFDLLTSWGFRWGFSKYASKKTPVAAKSWDERYQELLAYKAEHGHTKVPQTTPGLGQWVKDLRKQYNRLRRNQNSTITPEKIEKLQSIGFVFVCRRGVVHAERKIKAKVKAVSSPAKPAATLLHQEDSGSSSSGGNQHVSQASASTSEEQPQVAPPGHYASSMHSQQYPPHLFPSL